MVLFKEIGLKFFILFRDKQLIFLTEFSICKALVKTQSENLINSISAQFSITIPPFMGKTLFGLKLKLKQIILKLLNFISSVSSGGFNNIKLFILISFAVALSCRKHSVSISFKLGELPLYVNANAVSSIFNDCNLLYDILSNVNLFVKQGKHPTASNTVTFLNIFLETMGKINGLLI